MAKAKKKEPKKSKKQQKPRKTQKPKKQKKGKEKPEQPKCDCKTSQTFYATSEALRMLPGTRILRYAIKVGSEVVCEPKTPGHCLYHYSVNVSIWARDLDQNSQPTGDWYETDRKPAIESLRMTDPSMRFAVRNRKPLELMLRHSEWAALAPKKAKVEVTAGILPDAAAAETLEWTKSVELCVPRLPNPNCPEWI